jgi:3-methyl-2-oxobutanoate hydroxymethyltransferase
MSARIDEPTVSSTESGVPKRVTLRDLRRWRREGTVFPCLTAYDATMARWLSKAGVPVLLVGDSAAEVILGLPSTMHAPLDFLLQITAAVRRGAPNSYVIGDMPFLSYHADENDAVMNAGRFMVEGGADAVKLEADARFAPVFERLSRAGIPAIAHVGCLPQQVQLHGGYAVAGRTAASAKRVVEDAKRLVEAGAIGVLAEATTAETAEALVNAVDVPVIGCGAGPACHGQIVVTQDILGLTAWQPSFASSEGQVGISIQAVVEQWCEKVRRREIDHPYMMKDGEAEQLEE